MHNSTTTTMSNESDGCDPPYISQMLCKRCRGLCESGLGWCNRKFKCRPSSKYSHPYSEHFYIHHRNIYILRREASGGCQLCQMIRDSLEGAYASERRESSRPLPACMDRASEAASDECTDESDDELKDVLEAIQAFEGEFFLSEKNDRITEICGDGRVILWFTSLDYQHLSFLWTNPEYMWPQSFHKYETWRGIIHEFRGQPISFSTNISPSSQHLIPIHLSLFN